MSAVPGLDPDTPGFTYDEFAYFGENCSEYGLPWDGAAEVERVAHPLGDGREVAALRWGEGDPEVVFLHGGAQNAHTWDTVALALDRPLVAIDLPGHGHSQWRDDKSYRPEDMADDVAAAMTELAPSASTLVGMSLGGLTAIATLAVHPGLADRLVLVDVTPGVDHAKAEPILAFIAGPEEFESFDAILERTISYNPTRSHSSLRRGVLHNAKARDDGTWVWRYDLPLGDHQAVTDHRFTDLWDAVSAIEVPILLVRGALSGVVDDADVEELRRRRPDARVVVVDDAGHSVQGDRPLVLSALLADVHG